MVGQRTWKAHPHLAWAMWGLDEIEATLASIEDRIHKHAHVRSEAEHAIAPMRAARDAFRKSVEEPGHVNAAAFAPSKAALERQWSAFEESVQAYLDTVGRQVSVQGAIFRARAEAQNKAWQEAIGDLHKSVAGFTADRHGEIEAAIKRLESEAEAAKLKLDKLNDAEGASWDEMKSALTQTRAALERTHQAMVDVFARAA